VSSRELCGVLVVGMGTAVGSGGGAGEAAEGVAESGFVGIADFRGDDFDAKSGLAKELFGLAHAAGCEVLEG